MQAEEAEEEGEEGGEEDGEPDATQQGGEDDAGAGDASKSSHGQQQQQAAFATSEGGCRVVMLSPFEVHFSQTRVRAEFQDGHTLEESMAEIQALPWPEGATDSSSLQSSSTLTVSSAGATGSTEVGGPQPPTNGESPQVDEGKVLLGTSFPRIEVTRWHCKLREADGSAKVDEAGNELYSQEERWFTFDNRRLCCLQRVAARQRCPNAVRVECVEIPQALARMRELRKFDTKTLGRSVLIGRRNETEHETWCWRTATGMSTEMGSEVGVARQKGTSAARYRGRAGARDGPQSGGRGGGKGGGKGRRGGYGNAGTESRGRSSSDLVRHVVLFLLVYIGLRVVVSCFRSRVAPLLQSKS